MIRIKHLLVSILSPALAIAVSAADLTIISFNPNDALVWTNAFPSGICTIEAATQPEGPWSPRQNLFTTNSMGTASLPLPTGDQFYRLLALDLSTNALNGFSNLVISYGQLHTIAGNGVGPTDNVNYWQPQFEGGPATNAALSRPHFAMADGGGNIFIVDKDSHSVLKVTRDGFIHTVAGTHASGNGTDQPAFGTQVALNSPNGLWVRRDGTVYVLDVDNGKVRRLTPDGIMSTVFALGRGINVNVGRGLWVSDDETRVLFANGTNVIQWTRPGGFSTLSSGFVDLGNLVVDADGAVVVTDRGASQVYRIRLDGSRDLIAGNGSTKKINDGASALTAGVPGVRGVWFLPNHGYLLATHAGSQILYVDPRGRIYVFLDGKPGDTHAGDGQWFHTGGNKIADARSVTLDYEGNIIIVENDAGYVRKIDFQRLSP
jgi:hypothetical protein